MSDAPVVAFFGTQRRTGQTTLVYHLACLLAELGKNILVVDLDPQGDLSAQFDQLDAIEGLKKIKDIRPSSALFGELSFPASDLLYHAEQGVAVIVSSETLLLHEETLSRAWVTPDPGELTRLSQCWRNLKALDGRRSRPFDLILLDTAHNTGAVTRTALLAADAVVLPVQPEAQSEKHFRLSLEFLRHWRQEWRAKLDAGRSASAGLPPGSYSACGYVVTRGPQNQPSFVGAGEMIEQKLGPGLDCPPLLGTMRHFGELQSLSREARKPMFALKAADGAVGSHARSVSRAREAYEALASRLLARLGLGEAGP